MVALDGERIKKCDGITGELVHSVACLRRFRVAEAALIQDQRMTSWRKERQNPAEREPGIWPPVQEHDRVAVGVTLFGVVDLRTSC
jgi:hypothetical protein